MHCLRKYKITMYLMDFRVLPYLLDKRSQSRSRIRSRFARLRTPDKRLVWSLHMLHGVQDRGS